MGGQGGAPRKGMYPQKEPGRNEWVGRPGWSATPGKGSCPCVVVPVEPRCFGPYFSCQPTWAQLLADGHLAPDALLHPARALCGGRTCYWVVPCCPPLIKCPPHSPSHTVRCWHGVKSTSSASSEHTRHSAASCPAAGATCRLVTVLGVLRNCLGPVAVAPTCRSLQWEAGLDKAGVQGRPHSHQPQPAHRKRWAQPCRALSTRPSAARSSGLRPRWLA